MSPRPRKLCSRIDDGSTATLAPTADPAAIAERVSRQQVERIRTELADGVTRWRKVVADVAAGVEPDGRTIDEIGELVDVLNLPGDSLATHVSAWREDSRLADQCTQAADELKRTRGRNAELAEEIKTLEKRLGDLRLEVQKYHGTAAALPSLMGARSGHQGKHPILFAPVNALVEKLAESSTATTARYVGELQAGRQFAGTVATWGT